MTDSTIHASDIQQAQARISSEIAPTPLQYCARLSAETGCEVYLKREDLQDVRSYKIRGALNGMSNLPQEQRHRGIVTASAGNHAQLSLIHISEPTRPRFGSRMPSSA